MNLSYDNAMTKYGSLMVMMMIAKVAAECLDIGSSGGSGSGGGSGSMDAVITSSLYHCSGWVNLLLCVSRGVSPPKSLPSTLWLYGMFELPNFNFIFSRRQPC